MAPSLSHLARYDDNSPPRYDEALAAEMGLPLVLEGYEPPKDPRLSTLRVTPDPGMIEVNIHPVHSWSELVDQATHFYEAAHRHTRA